jgi:hypothetical protein
MVAVISHLRSVAEVMDRVLAVTGGPLGSQVHWLGGDERDDLITEDIEVPSNLTSDPSLPKAAQPVQDGFLAAQVSRSGDLCGRRLPLAGFEESTRTVRTGVVQFIFSVSAPAGRLALLLALLPWQHAFLQMEAGSAIFYSLSRR